MPGCNLPKPFQVVGQMKQQIVVFTNGKVFAMATMMEILDMVEKQFQFSVC
jgi:hypothetical protein